MAILGGISYKALEMSAPQDFCFWHLADIDRQRRNVWLWVLTGRGCVLF